MAKHLYCYRALDILLVIIILNAGYIEQCIIDSRAAAIEIVAQQAACLIEIFGREAFIGTQAASDEPEKSILRMF